MTFLYLPDEPGRFGVRLHSPTRRQPSLQSRAGKALPTFVTKHYVKELDGAIDIWDTGPLGYDIERADEERAKRSQILDL